jgi:NAD(P)-dependent dehydrogenase (short-subunit alcohol dehydrogenase family)/peptidoglycan/xylan/chitin deacetylase (PgdA/CDA1 family)
VTVLDRKRVTAQDLTSIPEEQARVSFVEGDLTSEHSVSAAFEAASAHFGPPCILVANAGITDESTHPCIWELDAEKYDKVHATNVRGTFLTVKHFLLSVKKHQEVTDKELENVAIVVTGSETGIFGQEGHVEYAGGKAGLQYGFVRTVKNEIVRLNSKARINAVAPGWINTPLIGDRLDDPREMWAESQATVALKKIAQPEDVARAMAFLASHRAAGHISGVCLEVTGGMEGRIIWREDQVFRDHSGPGGDTVTPVSIPLIPSMQRKRRLRVCLSVDFDAISGYLGTGHDEHNTLSDYSAGLFSANVGVGRLLRLFQKYGISDKLTWFIPGHSLETFPDQARAVIESGAEIGLHGYSHEGAYAMTVDQEKDVIDKCVEIITNAKGGKTPVGYRAPLYQIRETTVQLLQERGFLYDSSMNAYDSLPYFLPHPFPGEPPLVPDYKDKAASWMKPTPIPVQPQRGAAEADKALVEIPGSWYTEDMTPLGFYPYAANTQGYVSVEVVEKMWWDRFDWLWENESWLEGGPGQGYGSIYVSDLPSDSVYDTDPDLAHDLAS